MTRCAAVDCKNIGIHLFPKEAKRRKLWEKATARLCPAHFQPEDYYGRNSYTGDESIHKVLKKTAVPSMFSFSKDKTVDLLAQQRSDRLLERSRKKLCLETPGAIDIQAENKCDVQIFRDEQFTVQSEIEIPSSLQVELSESHQSSIPA